MLTYLLLGVAALGAFLLLVRWYTRADARTLLKIAKRVGIGLIIAAVILLIVTGRFGLALGAAAFLLPWAIRALGTAGASGGRHGGSIGGTAPSGGTSSIRTRFLHMSLDHASGQLDGEIAAGPEAGRRLSDLDRAELIVLLAGYRGQDPQSAQLLEAYLDRTFPDWRQHAGQQSEGASGQAGGEEAMMSRGDALRILGLEAGASEAEIKSAYHRLIASLHPDRGGSDYLAAQVNRARDVLLGR